MSRRLCFVFLVWGVGRVWSYNFVFVGEWRGYEVFLGLRFLLKLFGFFFGSNFAFFRVEYRCYVFFSCGYYMFFVMIGSGEFFFKV